MALQDICNSRDIFEDNETADCSSSPFRKMTGCHFMADFPSCKSSSLINFYIPVAGYLDESPIEFGQISTFPGPSTLLSQDSILPSNPLPSNPLLSPSQTVPLPFPMSHGTTTLAFIFQGGVLAAADTRSSCAGLVEGPASQKILPIHSHMVSTTSGTSADCALWKRILSRELRLYQLRHGRRLSTRGAAKMLSHMLHPFKGTELCVAAIMCGWDGGEGAGRLDYGGTETDFGVCDETVKEVATTAATDHERSTRESLPTRKQDAKEQRDTSGPSMFYVCSDGTRLQGTLFSVGSGSPYAYSVLDQAVKWELTLSDAASVAREAVYRATHRDAYSGNNVDIYHVSSKGWTRRRREDLKEEYYRERERRERGERKREREGERERERRDQTLSEGDMRQTTIREEKKGERAGLFRGEQTLN